MLSKVPSEYKRIGDYEYDIYSPPLGTGSYGAVYKGYHIKTREEVAIKIINKDKFIGENGELIVKSILKEIVSLKYIKDDNVLSLYDYSQTSKNIYIIIEYCDGGSLDDVIKSVKKGKGKIREQNALNVVKQIAESFIRVQKLGLVNHIGEKLELMHRDIKPANILFKQGKVKLADFGFSQFVCERQNIECDVMYGTALYMSPQILNFMDYSSKTDVWSTGVVLYEMLYGTTPWVGKREEITDAINNRAELIFPTTRVVDIRVKDLITKMLAIEEKDRITWEEILNHPAFRMESKIKLYDL